MYKNLLRATITVFATLNLTQLVGAPAFAAEVWDEEERIAAYRGRLQEEALKKSGLMHQKPVAIGNYDVRALIVAEERWRSETERRTQLENTVTDDIVRAYLQLQPDTSEEERIRIVDETPNELLREIFRERVQMLLKSERLQRESEEGKPGGCTLS